MRPLLFCSRTSSAGWPKCICRNFLILLPIRLPDCLTCKLKLQGCNSSDVAQQTAAGGEKAAEPLRVGAQATKIVMGAGPSAKTNYGRQRALKCGRSDEIWHCPPGRRAGCRWGGPAAAGGRPKEWGARQACLVLRGLAVCEQCLLYQTAGQPAVQCARQYMQQGVSERRRSSRLEHRDSGCSSS